jgi:hypothetical protein
MKKNPLLILLILGLSLNISCQSPASENNTNDTQARFTYEVELAGYEFGQIDEKGPISFVEFIKAFNEFPWGEQIEKANQAKKVFPTLSVNDNQKEEAFWVSAAGSQNDFDYLIGHTFFKEINTTGKAEKKKWVVIYWADTKESVEYCFKLFFEGRTDKLKNHYATFEKFGEMEAKN